MSVLVIEKSTGDVMAQNKDGVRALALACRRGVARKDMAFVVGDVDIRTYCTAKTIVGLIKYLPGYLFERGKERDYVEAAKHRLDLWQLVMDSRVVDDVEKYSQSLAEIFGQQLADEILVTIDAKNHPDCKVFAPATIMHGIEANQEGKDRAAKTRRHLFMLVKHAQLGVWIVGPSTMFPHHKGFDLERIFVGKKS